MLKIFNLWNRGREGWKALVPAKGSIRTKSCYREGDEALRILRTIDSSKRKQLLAESFLTLALFYFGH